MKQKIIATTAFLLALAFGLVLPTLAAWLQDSRTEQTPEHHTIEEIHISYHGEPSILEKLLLIHETRGTVLGGTGLYTEEEIQKLLATFAEQLWGPGTVAAIDQLQLAYFYLSDRAALLLWDCNFTVNDHCFCRLLLDDATGAILSVLIEAIGPEPLFAEEETAGFAARMLDALRSTLQLEAQWEPYTALTVWDETAAVRLSVQWSLGYIAINTEPYDQNAAEFPPEH